jgi:hypothetical protein
MGRRPSRSGCSGGGSWLQERAVGPIRQTIHAAKTAFPNDPLSWRRAPQKAARRGVDCRAGPDARALARPVVGRRRAAAAYRRALGHEASPPARRASVEAGPESGHLRARRLHERHDGSGPGGQGFRRSAPSHLHDQGRRAALRSGHRHGRRLWQGGRDQQRRHLRGAGSAYAG